MLSNVLDSLYVDEFQKNKHSYKKSTFGIYSSIYLIQL
ncbi:hypothetical protein QS9_1032 [Clostridioides difficile P20]|nr:hypothetical protein QS9_3124 [Clostridioides difficile P20]EQJ38934.1 hypothetical protein QS9_1032 [Clostridioides difficile P20]